MHLVFGLIYVFISICNCNVEANNVTSSETSNIPRENVPENSGIQSQQYTQVEKIALEKFRPLVKDIIVRDEDKSDGYLMRWLRAKNLDVAKAVDFLRADQKWRRENNIDTIMNETLVDIQPPPFNTEGLDREGHPVIVITPMVLDFRKFALQGETDKIYRYVIQIIETGMASRSKASKIFGRDINQVIPIFDFHGFNLRQHACLTCLPVFRDLFLVFEQHYPEAVKYFIAINVPRAALPILEFLKPLMSPSTVKALRVFPPDRIVWSKFLLGFIEPQELPYRFGGTKKLLI